MTDPRLDPRRTQCLFVPPPPRRGSNLVVLIVVVAMAVAIWGAITALFLGSQP